MMDDDTSGSDVILPILLTFGAIVGIVVLVMEVMQRKAAARRHASEFTREGKQS